VIAGLQADYAAETGVQSLKIKHNNVLGYFIETTATHAEKMLSPPLSERFIHRQTTANAVRFTTAGPVGAGNPHPECRDTRAGDRDGALPPPARAVLARRPHRAGRARAGRARRAARWPRAARRRLVPPAIDDSRAFEIEGGRHPVVEPRCAAPARPSSPMTATSTPRATARAITLLTGPNMAGKSTFLRQNALIAILAQMGSFVPAESAEIGVVSQVFSRVGASDDLARGRSTFMVEMVETAAILNQADDRALVILDEIGRGTATYDGLSIAWAAVEHLHEVNRCRALFATHYHELTALAEKLPG
jgi:DNA mismatch repair protein MutS